MYNLIKSEFYKLRYGKTYKGLVLFSAWCVVLTIIQAFNAATSSLEFITTYTNGRAYGFAINTFSNPENLKGIEFFASAMGWTPILVIGLTYLIGSLICEEYVNGNYKSILTYGHKRVNVYISKLITISIGIAILIFAVPIIALILGTIFNGWGIPFKIEHVIEMIKVLSISTIIFISIASIFILLGTVIKNKALVITIGIVFLVSPIFLLGNNIPIETIEYIPSFMLMDICAKSPSIELITKIIMTCTVITVTSTALGCYIFKNQDII